MIPFEIFGLQAERKSTITPYFESVVVNGLLVIRDRGREEIDDLLSQTLRFARSMVEASPADLEVIRSGAFPEPGAASIR